MHMLTDFLIHWHTRTKFQEKIMSKLRVNFQMWAVQWRFNMSSLSLQRPATASPLASTCPGGTSPSPWLPRTLPRTSFTGKIFKYQIWEICISLVWCRFFNDQGRMFSWEDCGTEFSCDVTASNVIISRAKVAKEWVINKVELKFHLRGACQKENVPNCGKSP